MQHYPVMLDQVIESLSIKPNGMYVDCTFGRGGHSSAILSRLSEQGCLLALDRDRSALESEEAIAFLSDQRTSLKHCSFSGLKEQLAAINKWGQVDGVLFDLGVSSPQLDEASRGFSFMRDGPLDMRMDVSTGQSAMDWLATVTEHEIVRVLFEYGEERYARRIAKAIVTHRAQQPITTTKQLADLVTESIPLRERHKHPATRTFQAIRIEINQELIQIETALQQASSALTAGGRLVVIAFHSLEDRLVKRYLKAESGRKFDPGKLPIKQADIPKGQLKIIGKAVKASAQEISSNPRARSAIMRVAEKCA